MPKLDKSLDERQPELTVEDVTEEEYLRWLAEREQEEPPANGTVKYEV